MDLIFSDCFSRFAICHSPLRRLLYAPGGRASISLSSPRRGNSAASVPLV
jgi:hypothetical protein